MSPSNSVLEAPTQHVKIRTVKKLAVSSFTHQNIGIVKKINSVVLPVSYSDKFYQATLSPELEDYCKLAFYNDIPVGALSCKFETDESSTRLYLATLCVLAPYRHQGVASILLDNLFKRAEASNAPDSAVPGDDQYPILSDPHKSAAGKDKKKGATAATSSKPKSIKAIYLHVHTANEDAKNFWESKGFKVVSTEEQYFAKLEPRSAWVMERQV